MAPTELHNSAGDESFDGVLGEVGDGAVGLTRKDGPEQIENRYAGKPLLFLCWPRKRNERQSDSAGKGKRLWMGG